jgi:glycosyltransferase involved in cell wall biosynthesis
LSQSNSPTKPLRLSVILPNRNHATLLPRALDALCRQTRQADEIIVIDDASTDASREIIKGFMARLPQLRLLENTQRLGTVLTLNRGVNAATSEAIYCGAADDAVDPDFIRTMLAALEAHPQAGLACAEARLISASGAFLGYRPIILPRYRPGYIAPGAVAQLLARLDHWVLSVVTIYRRDLLLRAGGFDPELGSLCDSFLARAAALEHGFVFVPKVLGTWNVQEDSFSRSSSTNVTVLSRLIQLGLQRIEAAEGRIFPAGYGGIFVRRMRFASARLAVGAATFDPALIIGLVQQGMATAWVLHAIAHWPRRLRSVAALGWLTLRLRPMSLPHLLATVIVRATRKSADQMPG